MRPSTPTPPISTAEYQGKNLQKQMPTSSKFNLHAQRMQRLARGGNSKSQKTLTQIDFFQGAGRNVLDEASLDYIDDGRTEELNWATEEKKAKSSEKKPAQRRNRLGRSARGMNETLTQKGFVIPHSSVLSKDHDVAEQEEKGKQERKPNRPRRKAAIDAEAAFKMDTIPEEPNEAVGNDQVDDLSAAHEPSSRKRRKLNDGARQPSSELSGAVYSPAPRTRHAAGQAQFPISRSTSRTPVTPHKPRRLVVPSSQSPESPDIMLEKPIFQSSPVRFPLTDLSRNAGAKPTPKKGSPELGPPEKECQLPQPRSGFQSSTVASSQSSIQSQVPNRYGNMETTPATSPPPHENRDNGRGEKLLEKIKDGPNAAASENLEPGSRLHKEKDAPDEPHEEVIYETDTQSEVDWFYDASSHISNNRNSQNIQESQRPLPDTKPQQPASEPDILPPQDPSSTSNLETCDRTNTDQSGSDQSMFYYRRPMDTLHHPTLAELRAIGPDKMAELFPDSVPEQEHETAEPSLPAIPARNEGNIPPPKQTSTRDPAEVSTEFVPDSSQPAPRSPGSRVVSKHQQAPPPVSSPSVVLVESSQRNSDNDADADVPDSTDSQGLPPRGMFTTSQLLPDSLMESIPSPPIWVSSQGQLQEEGSGVHH